MVVYFVISSFVFGNILLTVKEEFITSDVPSTVTSTSSSENCALEEGFVNYFLEAEAVVLVPSDIALPEFTEADSSDERDC